MNADAVTAADEVLDAEQVGQLLHCSGRHVRELVKLGKFPAPVRLGSLSRWSRKAVLAWLDRNTGAPAVVAGPAVERAGRAVQVRG